MKYFFGNSELIAVREVVGHGRQWGFGNMIDRLKKAWALQLKKSYPAGGWEGAFAGALFEGEELERLVKYANKNPVKAKKELDEYIGD